MERYHSIDVLRALAIIFMVPCHFLLFFSPYQPSHAWVFTVFNDFLGGLAAPFFLFLVGVSFAVQMRDRADSGSLLNQEGMRLLGRAGVIFLIGLGVEMSLEGGLYSWDVLALIGVSVVVLAFLRRLPSWGILALAMGIMALAPLLRGWLGYLSAWSPGVSATEFASYSPAWFLDPLTEFRHASNPNLLLVVEGAFINGYFPLFPWLAYPLIGLVAGRSLYGRSVPRLGPWMWSGVALVGLGVGVGLYAHQTGIANWESGYITTWSFFPLAPSWMACQLGVTLLLLGLFRVHLDGVVSEHSLTFYRFLSKYSLTAYWVHYLLAYWPVRLMGTFSDYEGDYMGNFVDAPAAVLLATLAIIGFYFMFMIWERFDGKYSCGWFLRQLSQPVLGSPVLLEVPTEGKNGQLG